MCGQGHAPAALPPGKIPGTHCTGGWEGPRTGLDGCRKFRPPPGFDPRTVQPVGSRYTDWAIPAYIIYISSSSSSSCSLIVRCVSCSLVLKVEFVPPSLLRSSNVPSSFWSVFQCLSWRLFLSILCTCCSHFFWYCFISFTMFCAKH